MKFKVLILGGKWWIWKQASTLELLNRLSNSPQILSHYMGKRVGGGPGFAWSNGSEILGSVFHDQMGVMSYHWWLIPRSSRWHNMGLLISRQLPFSFSTVLPTSVIFRDQNWTLSALPFTKRQINYTKNTIMYTIIGDNSEHSLHGRSSYCLTGCLKFKEST